MDCLGFKLWGLGVLGLRLADLEFRVLGFRRCSHVTRGMQTA